MNLIFATNNLHKIEEINSAVPPSYKILSLKDVGMDVDIPEEQPTIEGNASDKAWYVYQRLRRNCFADDTGLEIEALNLLPGVKSARYAGPECIAENNIQKVLRELEGKENRSARFRTVISLIIDGDEYQFEGRVNGKILKERRGTDGFGYDPVFQPDGYDKTFAEMPLDQKNEISHRGKAVRQLINFLKHLQSGK
jgi:XTP/dITP diphosphohydrolase